MLSFSRSIGTHKMLRMPRLRDNSRASGNSAPSSENTSCTWTGYPVDNRSSGDIIAVDGALLAEDHGYRAMMRFVAKLIAFLQVNDGIIGVAKLAGALDDRREDRA